MGQRSLLCDAVVMAYVIAQLSDIHIGGPSAGSGERFSMAVDELNAMTRQPDLVLLTGDVTHNAIDDEWNEKAANIEASDIPLEKTDISVDDFMLVWLPANASA